MRIGVPQEALPGENRVAATPRTVTQLRELGYDVVVERGAGVRSSAPDHRFADAGADIAEAAEVWGSDIVLAVNEPTGAQIAMMRPGAVLIAFLAPRQKPEITDALAAQGVTAMSMDMVPRTSRAQALDALSSMANISGYRAVVEAANAFGRFFTGQVTAAGKVPPAKVLVAGTGVAGLAAIGAANAMGAVVRATDVRPETAEQVESMGAKFMHVKGAGQAVSTDGYAKEASADYAERAAELYAEQAKDCDIIITTAAIPGRPSPRLLTAEMVATMHPGSVIVDLAAAGGGNCELTRPGESYTTDHGVTIIGYTDLASRLPGQSSQLYGTNLVNALKLMTPGKDGQLVIDFDDEVVRTMTTVRDGEITFPPGFEFYTPEQQAQFQQAATATNNSTFNYLLPALGAIAGVIVVWFLVGWLLHLLQTLFGGRGTSRAALNIAAWSSLPLIARHIVQTVVMLTSDQLIAGPGLSGFAPADEGITSALLGGILSSVDIFLVWQIILLYIGVRVSSQLPRVKCWLAVLLTIMIVLALRALPAAILAQFGGLTVIRPFL